MRIDRRRKLYATVLLRALGYSTEELLNYYYDTETVFLEPGKKYAKSLEYDLLPGQRATRDIRHPDSREILVKKNRKFTKLAIKKLKDSNIDKLPVEAAELVGKVAAHDVIDETTGEVLLQCNEELTESKLDELREHNIASFKVLFIDNLNVGSYLRDTLIADKLQTADEAILEIYRRLRPGDPPDHRDRPEPVQQPVLQPRALRPVEGRPPEVELQVQAGRGAGQRRPHQAGHPRDRPLPDRSQERQGSDRRHRPPG